ncbi:hypothetical protein D3C71_918910 [compost metagenome]
MLDLGTVAQRNVGVFRRAESTADGPTDRIVITLHGVEAICVTWTEAQLRATRAGIQSGTEIDCAAQLDGQVLNEHTGAERDIRVHVVRERSTQINRLQVGLHTVIATYPIPVVFGGETERNGERHTNMQVVVLTKRHVEVCGRNCSDHACVTAVAAADRRAGACTGRAYIAGTFVLEISREADRAHVGLELAAVEQTHRGRVGGDHRSVAPCAGRTGECAAQALGAVFFQLECRALGVAKGQRAGNADCQSGNACK